MKRAVTTFAGVLTVLAFAGCTASPDEASSSANPETTEATPVTDATEHTDSDSSSATKSLPDTDVHTDGPRAAEALEHLLTTLTTVYHDNEGHEDYTDDCDVPFETLEDYQVCSPSDPAGYLASFESPRDGELIITLMPEAWGGGEYDPDRVFTVPYLAGNLHSYIGRHTDGSLQVTITTPDGEHEATQGRLPQCASSDAPHTAAELEAWADARFDDWLRSMNFTYQGLCGGVDSVGDYRACVPDDPHGYITSVEAPAAGELVVHVENGAWQGGQYEPAAQFVAGNMVLRIGSYSNDIDLLTVVTEDGQSYTVQYEPDSGSYSETTRQPSLPDTVP